MMKLHNIENRSELFSMESAKILALQNPLHNQHLGVNKLGTCIARYRLSAHLIFGMMQAVANRDSEDIFNTPTILLYCMLMDIDM